jgi:MFS family permease
VDASGEGEGVSKSASVLRDRNFLLYFAGVVLSEAGVRGTLAINLYHVYLLSGSTAMVGVVGLFQGAALLVLGPLGGALADRLDRRRLVQVTQLLSFVVSAALAAVTFLDLVSLWHIYLAVLLNTAAATFDGPARWALIPGIVQRHQVVKAFALVNPGRQMAWLAGPAVGGLLVGVAGPGLMYAVDAATYLVLILALVFLRVAPVEPDERKPSILSSIGQGLRFVRERPIIWQLLALDLVTMLFGAWRVILPAMAEDVLQVGPTGYGFLTAVVPAGALVGSWIVYRAIDRLRAGRLVVWATAGYGIACIGLAQSRTIGFAVAAAFAIGTADALWSTVQQAAIQVETPDELRGRVSSLLQLVGRGGPSLGNANIGFIAGAIGPIAALTAGGLVPIVAAGLVAMFGVRLRQYQTPTAPGS